MRKKAQRQSESSFSVLIVSGSPVAGFRVQSVGMCRAPGAEELIFARAQCPSCEAISFDFNYALGTRGAFTDEGMLMRR